MATTPEQDPAELRRRAEETRREADRTADPITKETLLAIASQYDEVAAFIEAKLTAGDAA